MNCKAHQTHLADYVDGKLSMHDMRQVELHLAGCQSCRKVITALTALTEWVKTEKEIAPSPFLNSRIKNAVRDLQPQVVVQMPEWMIPARRVLAAASILAFIWAGYLTGSVYTANLTLQQEQGEEVYIDDTYLEMMDLMLYEQNNAQ
jgi:anti-sigma factor RsiW